MFSIHFNWRTYNKYYVWSLINMCFIFPEVASANEPLSFENAIKIAQKNDPWLVGNKHEQTSIELMSEAVNNLPDPKVSLGFANLPTNGFDFRQERMTQAKIGIAQVFPRGDSLQIESDLLKVKSEAYPFQRQNREAQVAVTVGSLWLDSYKYQQSIKLIEKNSVLFEQLVDVAQASYSSGLAKTRQQDIVRAQLELTRIKDRIEQLKQQKSHNDGMLQQWLSALLSNKDNATDFIQQYSVLDINLSTVMPNVELMNVIETNLASTRSDSPNVNNLPSLQELVSNFSKHPSVLALNKKIDGSNTGVTLAKQKYKPEWGVNASYGYRADDPLGNSRADLFSVGVTFDLPLFTANKQDKEVKSAIAKAESIKTEKHLMLRKLFGAYSSAKGRLFRLKKRQNLYKVMLIPQTLDQAEAALTAYNNDDGNFSDVVRSRIAVLNAEIDRLHINVNEQKINLELNYLFVDGTQFNQASSNYLYSINSGAK